MSEVDYRAARTMLTESGMAIYYRTIVAKVESLCPVVPQYNYKGESNIEEIKFKLAQKEFFDVVMSILNPKGKENE